jgi:hypothetical protein
MYFYPKTGHRHTACVHSNDYLMENVSSVIPHLYALHLWHIVH